MRLSNLKVLQPHTQSGNCRCTLFWISFRDHSNTPLHTGIKPLLLQSEIKLVPTHQNQPSQLLPQSSLFPSKTNQAGISQHWVHSNTQILYLYGVQCMLKSNSFAFTKWSWYSFAHAHPISSCLYTHTQTHRRTHTRIFTDYCSFIRVVLATGSCIVGCHIVGDKMEWTQRSLMASSSHSFCLYKSVDRNGEHLYLRKFDDNFIFQAVQLYTLSKGHKSLDIKTRTTDCGSQVHIQYRKRSHSRHLASRQDGL